MKHSRFPLMLAGLAAAAFGASALAARSQASAIEPAAEAMRPIHQADTAQHHQGELLQLHGIASGRPGAGQSETRAGAPCCASAPPGERERVVR